MSFLYLSLTLPEQNCTYSFILKLESKTVVKICACCIEATEDESVVKYWIEA